MTDAELISTILTHGLSIRQIPLKKVRNMELRHKREGDIEVQLHGRTMVQRTSIPEHPGYWMCQQVNDTSSQVHWNLKSAHAAPTLQESVHLFLVSVRDQ